MENNKKFCKYCGEKINKDVVVCPKCGRQVKMVIEEDQYAIDHLDD